LPKITYILPKGTARVIEVPLGKSVMQAAIDNRIEGILGECGGNCMCATCHVYVHPDFLSRIPAASNSEKAMLEITAAERRANSRLSCQIKAQENLDGLAIEIPARQR
jgi:2Fe-2S ferredoxin